MRVDFGIELLGPLLLQDGVAFGPRAVEGVELGLKMVFLVIVTVVATVGEGHRGEAQRQGHREQQHYGQLSGQLFTSFLICFFDPSASLVSLRQSPWWAPPSCLPPLFG